MALKSFGCAKKTVLAIYMLSSQNQMHACLGYYAFENPNDGQGFRFELRWWVIIDDLHAKKASNRKRWSSNKLAVINQEPR